MYLGLSKHIGHVVRLSSSGLRSVSRGYGLSLGRVYAEMSGGTPQGGLQANNHIRLHTDRCDVLSLLSLRAAPNGGASRVCSAPAVCTTEGHRWRTLCHTVHLPLGALLIRAPCAAQVYNAMLDRSPELAAALTQPLDRIWAGEKGFFRLPVVGLTPSGQFTTQVSPGHVW